MKPSEVRPFRGTVFPFVGMLGKTEAECAIAMFVFAAVASGDTWGEGIGLSLRSVFELALVRAEMAVVLRNPFVPIVAGRDHLLRAGLVTEEGAGLRWWVTTLGVETIARWSADADEREQARCVLSVDDWANGVRRES